MTFTNQVKDQRYLESLIKESNLLIADLAQMDKKMEKDILEQKGALAVWWEKYIENNKVASFAVDKARDKIPYAKPVDDALKNIFKAIFKTLKYSNIAISAVTAPFEATRQPSYKMAYLDSQFGNEYIKKQQRLEEIYDEIFKQAPPSSKTILQPDRCALETCWRTKMN